ncbi:MAG: RNA polymerase sigma factor [Candidatus Dormibacteria bacterium]
MTATEQQVTSTIQVTFMELYDREAPTVLRYCRVAVGDQEAEDVCADVFCSAWPAWRRFRGDETAARGWLMRIARNKVIDRSRATRRVFLLPLEAGAGVAVRDNRSDLEDVRAALRLVSRADRELLELRAAGLSHAEIGAVQGRNQNAVKMAWHRALQRIKPHLEAMR